MELCAYMKILVMIPAYNEAGNIENVIKDLRANAPQCDFLVLNDCSTDDTLPVLRAMQADYLDLPVNLGIGGTCRQDTGTHWRTIMILPSSLTETDSTMLPTLRH